MGSESDSVNSGSGSEEKGKKGGRLHTFQRWGEKLIYSKHMLWGIGLASFLEALIVPIPLETILIPLMQARRHQLFVISTVVLGACIFAAGIGYAIGYFVFDAIGQQIISWVSTQEQFNQVQQKMQERGFWFVFSVGVIPIPFQIAMLAAGVTKYSFALFLLATALSRGIRYYGLALLVYFTGNKAQEIFEKHKTATSVVFLVVVLVIWGYSLFG